MQIDRRDGGAVDTDTRSTTGAPRFKTKMGRRQRGSRAGTEIDAVTFDLLRGRPLEALDGINQYRESDGTVPCHELRLWHIHD